MKSFFSFCACLLFMFALLITPAHAGVLKFTAKHVAKPAAVQSFKAVKVSGKSGWKVVKAAKKVLY